MARAAPRIASLHHSKVTTATHNACLARFAFPARDLDDNAVTPDMDDKFAVEKQSLFASSSASAMDPAVGSGGGADSPYKSFVRALLADPNDSPVHLSSDHLDGDGAAADQYGSIGSFQHRALLDEPTGPGQPRDSTREQAVVHVERMEQGRGGGATEAQLLLSVHHHADRANGRDGRGEGGSIRTA